jgi:hypothetical protein
VPLNFYRGLFIIASQSLDLGHSLKSFKTVIGMGCLDMLMGCLDMALRSKNMLPGICVRTP